MALSLALSTSTQVLSEESQELSLEAQLFNLSLQELLDVKISVASLFEASELDVASSVSVVTRDQWNDRGARRLGDALESVPALVALPTWGGAEAIAIRGYGTELSVRGIANSLDGVPLNSYTYATSFYDKPVINLELLERVEVISGPGSTLYGSDAFHGVLAYQTRSSAEDSSEFSVRAGAPSYSRASLFNSTSIGEVRLDTGVAIQKQGRQDLEYRYTSPYGGQQETGTRDYDFRDLSGYASLQWGERDTGKWRFNVYASDYEAQDFPGIGTQFFARLTTPFDIDSASLPMDKDHSDQDSHFALVKGDFELQVAETMDLQVHAYHWESQQEWRFDNSRYPNTITTRTNVTLPCLTAPSNTNPNPLYCAHELQQGAEEQRSGVEVKVKSTQDSLRTKWVAGWGLERQKIEDSTFRRVAGDGTVYISETNPYIGDVRFMRHAFAQGSTQIIQDAVQVVYGLRYDDYSDIGSHSSPRLGLIFDLTENYTSKLLYGHAYRAPTAIERAGTFDAIIPNEEIEAEEIDTLEWVNIYHHKEYRSELTLFASKWENGIVLVPVGASADNQYQNTGKNRSYGVEVSSTASVASWIIDGSASYVFSENEQSDLQYAAFPAWLGSLQARYILPGNNTEIGVFQRIMLNYRQGDTLGSRLSDKARNYYRTDFNISHQLPSGRAYDIELHASLLNAFDRDNVLPAVYNAENGLPDLERRIELGMDWRF